MTEAERAALEIAYEALNGTVNLSTTDFDEISRLMTLQVEALKAVAEVLGRPADLSGAAGG